MNLESIKKQSVNRFTALIIGKSGIGKTSLIYTILGKEFNNKTQKWEGEFNDEKIFVLSAESGLLSISDIINQDLVSGFVVNSINDVLSAQKFFASKEFIEGLNNKTCWIFIDSLTDIADICENELKEYFKSKNDKWSMWGEYASLMINIIKSFRGLNHCNVIFTGLETIDKDENNRRYAAPAFSGKKLPEKIVSLLDEVFYMYKNQNNDGEYNVVLNTSSSQFYPGKDRSGKLNEIEHPNLLTIKNKIVVG